MVGNLSEFSYKKKLIENFVGHFVGRWKKLFDRFTTRILVGKIFPTIILPKSSNQFPTTILVEKYFLPIFYEINKKLINYMGFIY